MVLSVQEAALVTTPNATRRGLTEHHVIPCLMVLSFWLARCARRYPKRLLYAANFYLEVFSSNSHVVTILSFRASLKRPLGAIIYTIIDRYSLLGVALNIVDRGRSRDQFLTPFLFFYAAHVCLVCPGVRRTRYVVQSYLTPCW